MPSSAEQVSEQLVLKEDQIFVTTNQKGDIPLGNSLGLYYNDTRYLSLFNLTIEGKEPVLLSASSEFNFMANLQLTNPALGLEDGTTILPNTISLRRNRLIRDGMRERIGMYNYNPFPVRLRLRLEIGADFRDMFDVRGFPRDGRGTLHPPRWGAGTPWVPELAKEGDGGVLTLAYTGLDGKDRHTTISFDPLPTYFWTLPTPEVVEQRLSAIFPGNAPTIKDVIVPPVAYAEWVVELPPHRPWFVNLAVVPEGPQEPQSASLFDNDARDLRHDYESWHSNSARFFTDNDVFNAILGRSLSDLRVLVDEVPGGLLPAAGIPWYSVPFGRDSLITGLQTLMFNPTIAEGTLRYLARYQATEVDRWRDAEPGKILHELRFGEMAARNEIPHTPYYGTVDATPLFVMLFVETMRWTAPLKDEVKPVLSIAKESKTDESFSSIQNPKSKIQNQLYDDLLPNVMRAIEWIDNYGDLDGDGFVEYQTRSRWGLRNQGWKDSYDSLKFPDGRLPEPPIALVEVQAYVYAAKMGMAELLMGRGEHETGKRLAQEAQVIKERFNHDFWLPGQGFYAQALDGSNRPVPSISSNVGHALYCGIIDASKAEQVVQRLMAPDMLSGWGIRTLSTEEPHFNPMSYHNGSIWPHDNAIIAAGMRRYGFHKEATEVMQQVFDAGIRFRMFRLPELYCGFARDRRYYSVPAEYPVSCSPQAWAAGAIPHFCQTMLGAYPDANHSCIDIKPYLLPTIRQVDVDHLRVGDNSLSIQVAREGEEGRARATVKENPGGLRVDTD